MHRITFALFIFSVSAHTAQAEDLCPSGLLASRKGAESCWVQFELAGGEGRTLCIPRQLWQKRLQRGSHPRYEIHSLCGEWKGKWKAHRGFDREIRLSFVAEVYPHLESVPNFLKSLLFTLEKKREQVSERLRPHDPDGILRSLILSEKTPDSLLPLYRMLGFVHVFSASGIHLYVLSSWCGALLLAAGQAARIPTAHAIAFSRLIAFLFWFWVWILSGMRPGFLRPWVVVLLREGARQFGFRWKWWAPLFISLSIDGFLFWVRESPWAPGRLHYALAVGGGLAALEWGRERRTGVSHGAHLWDHLLLSFGSWLLTALWDAVEIGLVAWATPFLNLITLPLFSLILYPVLFFGLSVWEPLLGLAGGASHILVQQFSLAAMALHSLWVVPKAALAVGACMSCLFIILNLFIKNKFGLKILFLCLCILGARLPYFACSVSGDSSSAPLARSVEQLDVGQGDGALVGLGGLDAGIIDGGSAHALREADWIRLLSERGVVRLRWVALTHLDEDHAGALKRLALLMPVEAVFASQSALSSPAGKMLRDRLGALSIPFLAWEGDQRSLDSLRDTPFFDFPAREIGFQSARRRKTNRYMSAIWIPLQSGWNYLSLGDADAREEKFLIPWIGRLRNQYPGPLLLKISHHGSRYSSDFRFLKQIRPDLAWISSGIGNTYGHPSPLVLDRLRRLGIPYWRTDEAGGLSPLMELTPRLRADLCRGNWCGPGRFPQAAGVFRPHPDRQN